MFLPQWNSPVSISVSISIPVPHTQTKHVSRGIFGQNSSLLVKEGGKWQCQRAEAKATSCCCCFLEQVPVEANSTATTTTTRTSCRPILDLIQKLPMLTFWFQSAAAQPDWQAAPDQVQLTALGSQVARPLCPVIV